MAAEPVNPRDQRSYHSGKAQCYLHRYRSPPWLLEPLGKRPRKTLHIYMIKLKDKRLMGPGLITS